MQLKWIDSLLLTFGLMQINLSIDLLLLTCGFNANSSIDLLLTCGLAN